jgi:hypothetical protein
MTAAIVRGKTVAEFLGIVEEKVLETEGSERVFALGSLVETFSGCCSQHIKRFLES